MHHHHDNPGSLQRVYSRLHANRFDHVDQARRARQLQARLAEVEAGEQRKRVAFTVVLDALLLATLLAILVLGFH